MSSECVEWSTIIEDVKKHVVGFLDYESRCNLKLCSKSDRDLVDSTRFIPDFISVIEQEMRGKREIVLCFESKTLKLTENEGVVSVERTWNSMKNEEVTGKKGEVAVDFIEKNWMNDGKLAAKRIEILNVTFDPKEHWILECDELKLRMLGAKRLPLWLLKTVPTLKELEVSEWGIEGILDSPQVQNTRNRLQMAVDVVVSEQQMSTLRAPSLVLSPKGEITEKGAKKAFRRFVEEGRRGDPFDLKFSKAPNFDHMQLFEKMWNVEDVKNPDDDTEGFFLYKIAGGFQNAHGIHEISQVVVFDFATKMTLKVLKI